MVLVSPKSKGRMLEADGRLFWRDAIDLLRIRDCKAEGTERESWRKEIGEAMARKRAEAPYKKKKKNS
jgi:hypothetical protein